MTFQENLNRICKERGTTLTGLIKKMGLSTSKVSRWNEGALPKQEMLTRLAEELNCSVADFFADDETAESAKKEPASQMTGGLSDLQIQLINMILQMTEPEAAVLLAALSAQKGLHKPLGD